jgi:hypothetical protein
MTNWLESEEQKKIIEENDEKNRTQIQSKKEEIIHNNLKTFYDLCDRVNKLKYALKISRLNVTAFLHHNLPDRTETYYHSGIGFPGEYRQATIFVRGTREIYFSVSNNEIEITLFYNLDEHAISDNYGISYDLPQYPKKYKKEILKRYCSNQDLVNWQEEKMINTIRWIINELDYNSIEENLPGINEGIIEKERKNEQLKEQKLLEEKKKEKLEIERREKEADEANLLKSIGKGILGGLIGLIVGIIAGGIIAWVLWIVLKIFSFDIGSVGRNITVIIICAICITIGYLINYDEVRIKKNLFNMGQRNASQ